MKHFAKNNVISIYYLAGRPPHACIVCAKMKANTPLMGQIVDATNIFTFGNS
ncbi:MAG: hypothetical protein O3A97_07680 [Proteobacteria bacterium]|nr:hypothetical protein [Pseudomonadota bacterium]